MKLKYFFVAAVLATAVLCSASFICLPVSAVKAQTTESLATIAQLQAEIFQLNAQIQAILSWQSAAAENSVKCYNYALNNNLGNTLCSFSWYLGDIGQDCNTVCAGHGGCNIQGTKDFAGSGLGLDANYSNCLAILYSLGVNNETGRLSDYPYNPNLGIGCAYSQENNLAMGNPLEAVLDSATTTCQASGPAFARVCACNQGS